MLTPPPRCKMNRVDDLTIDYLTRSRDCRDFFFIIFFLHFSLSLEKKINKKFLPELTRETANAGFCIFLLRAHGTKVWESVQSLTVSFVTCHSYRLLCGNCNEIAIRRPWCVCIYTRIYIHVSWGRCTRCKSTRVRKHVLTNYVKLLHCLKDTVLA